MGGPKKQEEEETADPKPKVFCTVPGCDYFSDTEANVKRHISQVHPGQIPETSMTGPTVAMDRKNEFKLTLRKAGILRRTDAYADLFFKDDVDTKPIRLVNILKTGHEDPAVIDIVTQLWYAKTLREVEDEWAESHPEEGESPAPAAPKKTKKAADEEPEDPDTMRKKMMKRMQEELELAELQRSIKRLRQMESGEGDEKGGEKVPYVYNGVPMKLTPSEIAQFEALRIREEETKKKHEEVAEKPSKRVLPNGQIIDMTDKEWSSFQSQLVLTERMGGGRQQQDANSEALKRSEEYYKSIISQQEKRFQELVDKVKDDSLRRELNEIKGAVYGRSEIDSYLEQKKKMQETGLETAPKDSAMMNIETKKVEALLTNLTGQLTHQHNITNKALTTAIDYLAELKKTELRAQMGEPPEQTEYTVEQQPQGQQQGEQQNGGGAEGQQTG